VPLTDEQRQHMLDYIDRFYAHFLDRVTAGRPLTTEQVDAVGQGRIWTGRQALSHKLIDRIGGLREAVDRARELAGLPPDAKVVEIERPHGSLLAMMREGVTMTLRGADSDIALLSSAAFLSGPAGAVAEVDPFAAWAWKRSWLQRLEPGTEAGPLLLNPVMEALLEAP
jgi:ClpP class serine protease